MSGRSLWHLQCLASTCHCKPPLRSPTQILPGTYQFIYQQLENSIYRKSSIKPPKGGGGAYLISGPKRGGGLIRDGGLIERGGANFKSHIFDKIHNNFSYFTIIPITRTQQENGFVS